MKYADKEDGEHPCGDACSCKHDHDSGEMKEADLMNLQQQIMQQQMMEIEDQLNKIEAHRVELNTLLDSINELRTKREAPVLVPVGAGILAEGMIKDGSYFLVNVGANIMVRKSAEETKIVIEKQFEQLDQAKKLYEDEMKKLGM